MNALKQTKNVHRVFTAILSLLMILLFSAVAAATTMVQQMVMDPQMTMTQTSEYEIQLGRPEKIVQGDNEFKVKVSQGNTPAQSLDVKISAVMDTTDTSMNMDMGNGTEKAVVQNLTETQAGTYSGKINLNGDGRWLLTVQFLDQTETFPITVEKSGPNLLVIGGFIGIILIIIVVTGVMKKRKKASKEE